MDMSRRRDLTALAALAACVACAGVAGGQSPGQAPVNMRARYDIYMTHVKVGEITWTVHFAEGGYDASAGGKASGVLSVLLNGAGSVATQGKMSEGKPTPAKVTSVVSDEDGRVEVRMTYENGELKNTDAAARRWSPAGRR